MASDHVPQDGIRPSDPTLLKKTLNFGAAVVRHVADGCQIVDERIYAARLDICRSCASCDIEHLICRDCGCLLEFKAHWGSEGCPQRKWDQIE